MTVNIDSKVHFRGTGLLQIRSLLRAWKKDPNPSTLRYLKDLPDDAGDVLSLLQDAHEAHLIGMNVDDEGYSSHETFGLTGGGKAIAYADASKRVTKEAALKVLANVVSAAESLAKDPNAPLKVSKIWVFGSVINPDKSDVGDLDIAIETFRTKKWKSGYREMASYVDHFYPGLLPESHDGWDVDSDFVRKSLYGPRRNRLISETDIGILKDLHVPCAVVYEQKKGRLVRPKVIPHHPESKGRGSNIFPRRIMPELPPFAISHFQPTNAVLLALTKRYNRSDATLRLVTDFELGGKPFNQDSPALDGSSAFAITFKDYLGRKRPYHCLVTRSLSEGGSSFEYRCNIEFKRVGRSALGIQYDEQAELNRAITLMCQADASGIARRHNELGLRKPVRFIVADVGGNIPYWNTGNLSQELALRFKERVLPGLIRLPTPPSRPVPGPPRAGQVSGILLSRINDRKGEAKITVEDVEEFHLNRNSL